MAITVTPLLTLINDCEAADFTTGSVNTDVRKENASSLGIKVSNTTSAIASLTVPFAAADWSTGDHLYWWVLSSGVLDTIANGGIQFTIYTDASNYRTWYVGGADNYTGGWKCFCLDPTSTGSIADTGTYNSASITNIGIAFKTIAKVSGNISNCFWDVSRYGTGLRITSGVADAITWEDIYTVDSDNLNAYGVIDKQNGTYIMQGKFVFGNSGSAADIDFADTGSLCLWQANEFQSTTLNEIRVEGNSGTDTINFNIGTKVGTGDTAVGASGNLIRSLDSVNQPWKLDLSNTNISIANIYGSTLSGMAASTVANSIVEMITVTVDSSDQLTVGTADLFNSTISNSVVTTGAVLLPSGDTHVMRKMAFNNNSRAIEIDTFFAGGYTFNALSFSGNTFDVNNTSGSTQDVNKANGSNPNTYTGTLVNFLATFTLTLTDLIAGSVMGLTIVNSATRTELKYELLTTTSTTYSHSGGETVDILLNSLAYDPNLSDIYDLTLDNADQSIKFQILSDANFDNPV